MWARVSRFGRDPSVGLAQCAMNAPAETMRSERRPMTGRGLLSKPAGAAQRLAVALAAAALVTLGLAVSAQARGLHPVKGTVVHHNQGAGSFVVADRKGHLFAIHS